MSAFKEINCEGNIDYSTLTKKGETYPKVIYNGGALYMNENQSIPINMTSYPIGIEIQWSRYDPDGGITYNYGWHSFFYTKEIINKSGGIINFLVSQSGTVFGIKYIYISDAAITGHSQNDTIISGTVFGNVDNRNWALRKVIAW